jgi:hypothetical protein
MLTRLCRTVAAVAACFLAAAGGVVLAASPAGLAGVIAIGAVVGAIVATHLPATEPRPPLNPWHAAEAGALAAAVAGFALLATVGTFATLGAAAGPIFLVLLAVSGAGLWRHRAAWRAYVTALTDVATPPQQAAAATSERLAVPPQRPAVAPQIAVPGVATIAALCLAWRRSHWLLQSLREGPARAELVLTRGRLLDELERRDPVGFQRWLHGGAPASTDPLPCLTEHRVTPTPTGSPHPDDDDRRSE